METRQKPRKSIKSWFKKTPNQSPIPAAETVVEEAIPADVDNYRDQKRTEERYFEALKLLREALQGYHGVWGSFEFDELTGEPEKFDDALFKTKINAAM
jgi:hypothetical protein